VNKVDKQTCKVALCTQQLDGVTHHTYVTKAFVNTVDAEDGAVVVVETRAVKVIVTHPVLYTSLVFVNNDFDFVVLATLNY